MVPKYVVLANLVGRDARATSLGTHVPRGGTRLDVTAADARGAGAFSTLLLVGSMLLIAAFIVARKATRSAESRPLLATTA